MDEKLEILQDRLHIRLGVETTGDSQDLFVFDRKGECTAASQLLRFNRSGANTRALELEAAGAVDDQSPHATTRWTVESRRHLSQQVTGDRIPARAQQQIA